MLIAVRDNWLYFISVTKLRIKIKQLIKSVIGKRLLCPDNKFLINGAFSLANPVDLADRQSHDTGEIRQITIAATAQLKNLSSYQQKAS